MDEPLEEIFLRETNQDFKFFLVSIALVLWSCLKAIVISVRQ